MAEMGIYAITHIATGRQYIGSAVDLKSRWRVHRCELSKGRHHNPKLQNAWNRYGPEAFAFSVLEVVASSSDLIGAEQRWIDTLRPHYNILPKAGSILGSKRTPATIEKMRLAGRQRVHRRGYTRSAETRAKLSASHRGYKVPEEQRRRQSQAWLHRLDVHALAREAGIEGEVLGLKEAAARTGFSHAGMLKLVREGVVPAILVGRVWAIRSADFDALRAALLERRQHRQCRAFQGERHYAAKLAAADVLRIRALADAGNASVTQLARDYGVNTGTIWGIVHRKTWRHLAD